MAYISVCTWFDVIKIIWNKNSLKKSIILFLLTHAGYPKYNPNSYGLTLPPLIISADYSDWNAFILSNKNKLFFQYSDKLRKSESYIREIDSILP